MEACCYLQGGTSLVTVSEQIREMSRSHLVRVGADAEEHEHDHWGTPPVATYALHRYGNIPYRVWEPCAGRGWLAAELHRCRYDVTASDAYDIKGPKMFPVSHGHDFLDIMLEPPCDFEGIVTNPPFSHGMPEKMMRRALSLSPYVAFLCRLSFLEGQRRRKMFVEKPFTKALVFSGRINFDEKRYPDREGQLGGMIAYAWFIWDDRVVFKNKVEFIDTEKMFDEWSKEQNVFDISGPLGV